MIATIATIVEIELRSPAISAIVVATFATMATIAEERFPYERNDR